MRKRIAFALVLCAALGFWPGGVGAEEKPLAKVKVLVDETKIMRGKEVIAVLKKGDLLTPVPRSDEWIEQVIGPAWQDEEKAWSSSTK